MYKILVTGATGGLGRNLVERLNSEKFKVTAIGRNLKVGQSLEALGIDFKSCDLTNQSDVINLAKGYDYIVHTAALSSPWGKYEDFYQNNVVATENIINAAKENNIRRFVHVSTPSIYFDFTDRLNVHEESKLPEKFINNYAQTKYIAEGIVDVASKEGLETITIRPRAIFGKYDSVLMPRIIKVAKRGSFPIFNGGENLVDITYVDNVVESIILGLKAARNALGQKYNITNGEPKRFKDVLEKIFELLSMDVKFNNMNLKVMMSVAKFLEGLHSLPFVTSEPLITQYGIGVLSKSQTLDITKAKELLGYKPIIGIDEGMKRYAEWYAKHS